VALIGITGLKTLASSWNYWAISLSTFLRYGSFASIQALWIGPFLIQYLKLPAVAAGNLLLILNIGWILGSWCGEMLSDRFFKSRKWTHITSISSTAMGVLVLAQWQSKFLYSLLGAVLFCIAFFCFFWPSQLCPHKGTHAKRAFRHSHNGLQFFPNDGRRCLYPWPMLCHGIYKSSPFLRHRRSLSGCIHSLFLGSGCGIDPILDNQRHGCTGSNGNT
jgi:hypothetical protein